MSSVIGEITALRSTGDVVDYMAAAGKRYGFDVLALGELPGSMSARLKPFFYTTWPQWWYDIYVEAGLASDDPLVVLASRVTLPFAWSDITSDLAAWNMKRGDLKVVDLAREHGWPEGFAVPIHGPQGFQSLVSWAGNPQRFTADIRADLHLVAIYGHERLLEHHRREFEQPEDLIGHYGLGKRELDVLTGLARGGSDRELAGKMGLRERTVMHYAQTARRKLGCKTRAQAVAVATQAGIIHP